MSSKFTLPLEYNNLCESNSVNSRKTDRRCVFSNLIKNIYFQRLPPKRKKNVKLFLFQVSEFPDTSIRIFHTL